MRCVLCKHGATYAGIINLTLERDGCIIILKDVPADICKNCGEYYLSQDTTVAVLARAFRSLDLSARASEMQKLKFFALLPKFWNVRSNPQTIPSYISRSSLKDLEARSNN